MVVVLQNNKRGVLRQDLLSSGSSVVVTDSTIFPTLAVGEYFYLTISRLDGTSEIVKVVSVSGATLTVLRAQEGTIAREFPAGSFVEIRVTAASVRDAAQDIVDALTLIALGITATAAELNTLDGITASTAELNILDGVVASTAEINVLDGMTASTTELNVLDGILSSTAELNILDGVTATAAEINILDGVTATAAEINTLDGVTATTAEINVLDGILSSTTELNFLDGLPGVTGKTSLVGSTIIAAGTQGERDGSPLAGYFRFNSTLSRFEGFNGTLWGAVGGGATGGAADAVFIENDQVVTANYTINTGKHAMSTGPITINSGVIVTVPSGSNWVVI